MNVGNKVTADGNAFAPDGKDIVTGRNKVGLDGSRIAGDWTENPAGGHDIVKVGNKVTADGNAFAPDGKDIVTGRNNVGLDGSRIAGVGQKIRTADEAFPAIPFTSPLTDPDSGSTAARFRRLTPVRS